ncbi:family 43 glycosylhydrolase [Microbispora sp. NPDC046933]|uniref:family 43 glycosylhydrolase n=1 Tax=Microbispora sp. NPDC046933 TaxID=3155618 RepID=UPI0033E168A2
MNILCTSPPHPRRHRAIITLATVLLAGLLTVITQNTPALADTWQLTGNVGSHDPTIMKEGNTWWVSGTGAGIPMKSSPDGHNWTQRNQIFRNELPWWRTYAPGMRPNDVWAADMHTYNGRVWLYYSVYSGNHQSAIGLTSASSVASGDWRDDGMVINSALGQKSYNTIDPDLVFDANGEPWLVFGSWFSGIYVTRIDPATMKPTGPLTRIAARANGIEGPNIVYANGYYYLIVSFDHCCNGVNSDYKIAYGRSRSITGPYTDARGADMINGGGTVLESSHGNIIGPGGQSVIRNGSGWLIIRHYYDGNAGGAPKMLINDLYFDAAGWPTYTPSTGPTPSPTAGSPTPSTSPTGPPPGSAPCRVAYTVTNQWSGGFGAGVTITNTSASPVNGWTLSWSFPNGQTITQIWNATASSSGAQVNVRNLDYDATIPANGGNVSFGFNGAWNGANNPPSSFTLNGTTCTGG